MKEWRAVETGPVSNYIGKTSYTFSSKGVSKLIKFIMRLLPAPALSCEFCEHNHKRSGRFQGDFHWVRSVTFRDASRDQVPQYKGMSPYFVYEILDFLDFNLSFISSYNWKAYYFCKSTCYQGMTVRHPLSFPSLFRL